MKLLTEALAYFAAAALSTEAEPTTACDGLMLGDLDLLRY